MTTVEIATIVSYSVTFNCEEARRLFVEKFNKDPPPARTLRAWKSLFHNHTPEINRPDNYRKKRNKKCFCCLKTILSHLNAKHLVRVRYLWERWTAFWRTTVFTHGNLPLSKNWRQMTSQKGWSSVTSLLRDNGEIPILCRTSVLVMKPLSISMAQ